MLGYVILNDIENLPSDYSEQLHKIIGQNVKNIRKVKNISQLKLAYALGYKSVSPISGAEIYYNKIHFKIEHLTKIAYLLDVDICDFFEGTDKIIK
jgi:transcriptional regulator with XRE-family HTH domain